MATIYSVTDGGKYHWNDTSAWSGGVIPTGSGDIAVINHTFTLTNSGSGYSHFEGVRDRIVVDSTSGFQGTSGSFFTWISPTMKKVQITYDSTGSAQFNNCRISQSYQAWEGGRIGITDSGSNVGYIPNNAPVFTEPTTVYLSGSSTWHIGRIHVQDQAEFIIKDNACLRLDSTSVDSYVELEDGVFKMLDNTTASLAGTTERNSSLVHHDAFNYASILISGSSDLRTRTSITTSTPVNVGTINVSDSSNFEEGDYISVYSSQSRETVMTKDNYNNYHDERYRYNSSGSIFPEAGRKIKKKNGSFLDENETLVVAGKENGKLYVHQMFSKEGTVFATNSFNRNQFLRDRGAINNFTGKKTEIRVRSNHNSFKAGETIVTDGGKAYTILRADDILVPYKTVNFANGDNLHDNFIVNNFVGSGSGTQYQICTDLDIVSGSFGLTISGSTYSTNNYRKTFLLKNTKLRDYKITLSGSILRHYDGSSDTNRRIAIMGAADPHQLMRDRDIYGGHGSDRYVYTSMNGDILRNGNYPWGYNHIDMDEINDAETVSGITSSRNGPFTLVQDCLREQQNHSVNGVFISNTIKNQHEMAVGFRLRRENATIHSFVVQEYVQRLLLDTSDTVPVGTEIYEGATLTPHTSGQKVVTIAHTIKDLRGYKEKFSYYYAPRVSGSSLISYPNITDEDSVAPIIFDNNGDLDLYFTSDTGDRRNTHMYMFYRNRIDDAYYRLASNNAGSHFTLNLGADVTFDAIGFSMFYDQGDGRTIGNIGVFVSNDGVNFTEVREAATDTRVSYVQPSYRILHLAGGAVTAKFIKVTLSGTSQTSTNYITKFNVHHFNGRGNSIELNNASDIGVGDLIHFSNPQSEQNSDYRNFRNAAYKSRAQAGTDTETNSIGGVYNYYTVTAKSGNVITVNKQIATTLWEDSLVTKINRSITVKSESHIPFGFHYASGIDEQRSYEYYNVACLSLGSNSRERLYWYQYPDAAINDVHNCSFNYQEAGSLYMQASGMVFLNNIFINGRVQYLSYGRGNCDAVVQGNIMDSTDYAGIYNSFGQNLLHTGNIMLSRRYLWVQGHSGTEYNNIGISIARGNYFRTHDYYALYQGYAGSVQSLSAFQYYANRINTRSAGYAYYRTYSEVQSRPYQSRLQWEFPDQYPMCQQGINGYGSYNLDNIQPVSTTGTDYHEVSSWYDHSMMDGKSYIDVAGRMKIMQNHDNRNLYDLYSIHFNRIGSNIRTCNFHVHEEQATRVQVKITYKCDVGVAMNDRSGTINGVNGYLEQMHIFIMDHFGRMIPGTKLNMPLQETMSEYTYDQTVTLSPGLYSVYMHSRRDGHYSMRLLTFSKMSCVVSGAKPREIEIIHNGFHDYEMIKDPSKNNAGFLSKEGQEPIINNPARTTLRFRKIRF